MKKYLKEIIVILIQILLFYVYPLFSDKNNPFGMVLFIILGTFILSIIFGMLSDKKIKYLYPVITSIIFIPTVFIYYNESALIHSLWYLIDSYIGLFIGNIIKRVRRLL